MDLSAAPIRVMEPAIVDRLRLGFPSATFAIERIPQTMTLKEFERVVRTVPFIGLAWTGFRPDGANTNGRITKGDMLWRLVLVYKASSGFDTRFKGDKRGIGLDAMLDVSVLLLNGAVFDGIGTSQVTLANSVTADGLTDEALVVAQVDFTVKFTATPARLQLVTPEDFARFGITWIVEPEDDAAPDVTDTIDLPTGD